MTDEVKQAAERVLAGRESDDFLMSDARAIARAYLAEHDETIEQARAEFERWLNRMTYTQPDDIEDMADEFVRLCSAACEEAVRQAVEARTASLDACEQSLRKAQERVKYLEQDVDRWKQLVWKEAAEAAVEQGIADEKIIAITLAAQGRIGPQNAANQLYALMRSQAVEAERARIREALDRIVISEGEDAGVILLPDESPTDWSDEHQCHVYRHEHFSPLGDALVALARSVK